MARPFKSRSIMEKPLCCRFVPEKITEQGSVVLTLDEFEVIRKCDYERLSQENCATVMQISRTTVQRIYASARIKLAEALVLSKVLEIEGGPINMVDKTLYEQAPHINERGELSMKIAIGLNGLNVAGHFGQCNDFRIVEIENNTVVHQEDIHDEVHVHHERPAFLKDKGVDVLIMNGIGKGAYNRLVALNINCVSAEDKSVDDALAAYLDKTLTKPLDAHECAGCGSHEHHHEQHHEGHRRG